MQRKSSRRWLREHFSDPYVKQAKQSGLRSRAFFKLQELQERNTLFKLGMTVIDIGAAPGGWSEYLAQCLGKQGAILAVDVLPMAPIAGVEFIQGDFQDPALIEQLLQRLAGKKADWVISDMAPNLSGIDSVDQAKSIRLGRSVLLFANQVLAEQGGLLLKVFQGEGFEAFLAEIKHYFKKVTIRKPKASRGRSREVYILAKKTSF